MNLGQMRTELWGLLGEPSHIPNSVGGRLDTWLNFAYKEIYGAIRFYEFETTATVAAVAGSSTFAIPSNIRSILSVRRSTNNYSEDVTTTTADPSVITLSKTGIRTTGFSVTISGTEYSDGGTGSISTTISGKAVVITLTSTTVSFNWTTTGVAATVTVTYQYEDYDKLTASHYKDLDELQDTSTGEPEKYARFASNLELSPTPEYAYNFIIRGRIALTELTVDGDSPMTPTEWDEIILRGGEERGLRALGRKEEAREAYNTKIQLIRSRLKDETIELIDSNFGVKVKV